MPEIRYQQPGATSEISLAEIHIPNDSDFGTGTFANWFVRRSLPSRKQISSIMMYPPRFQISVTVNPNREVVAVIGKTEPEHQMTFVLPNGLNPKVPHELVVNFAGWRIVSAAIDGEPLEAKRAETEH